MINGTQISDMTNSLTVFPSGSFVPFVVTDPATGLNTAYNYRFDLGANLLTRVSYAALAANGGAALIGEATGETVQAALDHGGFFTGSGSGAYVTTTENRLNQTVSVLDYIPITYHASILAGAISLTGSIDLVAYFNAATAYALTIGAKILVPQGVYPIAGTWKVGATLISNYAPFLARTDVGDLAAQYTPYFSVSNYNANKALKNIDIEFEGGACIVAVMSWAPSVPTPMLEWNLPNERGKSEIRGRGIFTTASRITAGQYQGYDGLSTPNTSNNLIGIVNMTGSLACLEGTEFGNLNFGCAGMANYWTQFANLRFENCGDALNIATANAVAISNLIIWYGNRGLVYDGGGSNVQSIHTEQVAQDVTIFGSECDTFENFYLEDVAATSGAGSYAIRLGYTANAIRILDSNFSGIRVGSVRPSKKAYRIYGTNAGKFDGCREYGNGVDIDTDSRVQLVNCDATFAAAITALKRATVQGPYIDLMVAIGSGTYTMLEKGIYTTGNKNYGTLAAGAVSSGVTFTYPTAPARIAGIIVGTTVVQRISGGNTGLIYEVVLGASSADIKVTNGTNASIDCTALNLALAWEVWGNI